MNAGTWASIINLTICFAIPLMLVALGGMYSERSGIINLALEGIMVMGALAACLVLRSMDMAGWGETVGKAQLGVLLAALVAGVTGMAFSLLLAFAAINLKADQTIGGTALNIFAPAFCIVVAWAIQGQGITDIAIPSWTRLAPDAMGIAGKVNQDFLPTLFKKFYITVPLAVVLFLIAWVVLYYTRFGLRLRACGEHPQAADSVGINVYKMRWAGVLMSGILGGIGGMAYIVPAVGEWNFEMGVAGMGFLALAVMSFGQWKPLNIAGAALFFAVFRAMANIYDSFGVLARLGWPKEIYNMMPFVASMIVLAFTSKSSRAPKAEGIPYDKGSR